MKRRQALAALASGLAATAGCTTQALTGSTTDTSTRNYPTASEGESIETPNFRITLDVAERYHVLTDARTSREITLQDSDDVVFGGFAVTNLTDSYKDALNGDLLVYADGAQQSETGLIHYGDDGVLDVGRVQEFPTWYSNSALAFESGSKSNFGVTAVIPSNAETYSFAYLEQNGRVRGAWRPESFTRGNTER